MTGPGWCSTACNGWPRPRATTPRMGTFRSREDRHGRVSQEHRLGRAAVPHADQGRAGRPWRPHGAAATAQARWPNMPRPPKRRACPFVVFNESLEKMTPEKLDRLKAECKQASTADFYACPGVEFTRRSGESMGDLVRAHRLSPKELQARLRGDQREAAGTRAVGRASDAQSGAVLELLPLLAQHAPDL